MITIEDRLRAAARAQAATVAPGSVPPLHLPPAHGRRRGAPLGRRPGWLAPLASAAVAAVVVSGSLAASHVIGGGHAVAGHRQHPPAQAPAQVPALARPATVAGLPPFAITPFGAHIMATATGRQVATAALPGLTERVAAGSDGRTFYAAVVPRASCGPSAEGAARPPGCGTPTPAGAPALASGTAVFYRIAVTATGVQVSKLPIPPVSAQIAAISPAPDGSRLAIATYTQVPVSGGWEGLVRTVIVASTTTGRERRWITARPGSAGGQLSWLADGHTLAFGWLSFGAAGATGQLRLLDTARPGRDLLSGRAVLAMTNPAGVFKTLAISPDGSTIAGAEERGTGVLNGQPLPVGAVVAFSARTAEPLRLAFPASSRGGGTYLDCQVLWLSHTGQRLLASCDYSPPGTHAVLTRVVLAGPGHAWRQLPWLARAGGLAPGDLGQR